RKLGDSFHEGRVLLRAGTARLSPDCAEESERLLREAHALVRPFGTTKTLARCLSALASARLFAGDLPDAHSLHRQALDVYRDLGEGSNDRANSCATRARSGQSGRTVTRLAKSVAQAI